MKNIIYIIGSVLILSLLGACKKSELDRTPLTNISAVDFWKSENDLKLYANGFYGSMPNYTGYNAGIYSEDARSGTDDMVGYQYDRYTLNGERIVPATDGGYSWGTIRNINYFIQNYTKALVSAKILNTYAGEAYFFRALAYFSLLKKYGDLPWVNQPIDQNDEKSLKAPRLPRNIIVDSMMMDLNKSIAYLPNTPATAARVTAPIARALKARISLYEGTWEKYHAGTPFGVQGQDGSKYIQMAANETDTIMNSGFYSLDNVGQDFGYWKLFNQSDYSKSKEVMFWRKYDPSVGLYNFWPSYIMNGGGTGLTKNFIDDFLCKDGKPIAVSVLYQGDDSLLAQVQDRDPRLRQIIGVNDGKHPMMVNSTRAPDYYFKVPSFSGSQVNTCATGFQGYKGLQIEYAKQLQNQGDGGLIYYRYAEILLINAEAKAELGIISQMDIDNTINKLRDRVGMAHLDINQITTDPNWIFKKVSPLINEIRRERRVEFAAEGYRHDDIWRWAVADEVILGWKPKGAKLAQWKSQYEATVLAAYKTDSEGYIDVYQVQPAMSNGYQFKVDRDYLFPLPIDQLTLNKENLKQNPGW